MSNQVVLITGALTGIGRATAVSFAEAGATVVISGRHADEGQKLAAQLRALGAKAEEQRFDRYPDSVVPGPGGTSLHFVTFPPGSVFANPSFDSQAAHNEALIRLRGLADHFEKEDPAMHKTNTVDYSLVYEGEIWLEVDDAKTIHLKRGDVVVQNGTRHAWRNNGTTPATMLFFLNGAKE
jgi:mannose-6-phosphate isomerase-like protein (cupin superfamily)